LQRANRRGILPFTATSFGSWWGNDPLNKTQADFDVIAANRGEKRIILGECKWKSSISLATEADKLKRKEHLLAEYNDRHYYIFTKNKPDKKQKYEGINIITVEMLYGI
jgi:hypothetical protein